MARFPDRTFVASLLEIGGCFAFWQWTRHHGPVWVPILGVGCLIGFAVALVINGRCAEDALRGFKLTHYHQTLRVTPAMEAGIADHV